jgi:Na+-driven multidrug efflux pump
MVLVPDAIVRIFSHDDELVKMGSAALRANGFIFFAFGFQMVYSTLFLALGMAREGGILSMSRQGIFFFPLIIILPKVIGLTGIIYTQMFADILAVILTTIFALKLGNTLKEMEAQNVR